MASEKSYNYNTLREELISNDYLHKLASESMHARASTPSNEYFTRVSWWDMSSVLYTLWRNQYSIMYNTYYIITTSSAPYIILQNRTEACAVRVEVVCAAQGCSKIYFYILQNRCLHSKTIYYLLLKNILHIKNIFKYIFEHPCR